MTVVVVIEPSNNHALTEGAVRGESPIEPDGTSMTS